MHYLHAYMYMPIKYSERGREREGICDSDHLGSYTTTMWRYERHIDAYSGYSCHKIANLPILLCVIFSEKLFAFQTQ